MFPEAPVKSELDGPTTASPQAPHPAAPLPPPLPNATASSSSSTPLVWPAGSGLVFYWDPRTALARRTYQGLMKFTKGTLVSTQWIYEATHVLIDVNKPLSSRDREYYKGKLILTLDWARDSVIEGGPKDVNDENYQVVWEQEEGGGERDAQVVGVAKKKGKKKAREEVRRASTEEPGGEEDSSSGDDRPLHKRSAPVRGPAGRWTEEENLDYARFMAAYPNPNWGHYHDSHPSRSLSAIDQHYYHKRAVIDPLTQKIKKEANGRSVVYVHPIVPSASSSSSRPNPPPPRPSNNDNNDDLDRSSGDEAHHVAQPSSSNLATRPISSNSSLPCVNCRCKTSSSWHRLKEFDTGDQQFCSGCRSAFYVSNKKDGFEEGKQALARRRERILGPDASDLDLSDDDQPRRATITTSSSSNHASSSARHSLPNTTSTSSSHHHQSSSSSHHRSSLPGPSTSSYLAPPPPSHKRARSTNEDVDPRLEKRRRKLAKMGASASASTSHASTSYNNHNHNAPPPSNNHRLPSSSPSAPPDPFLLVGTKPSGCTTNRWCWVCGSDSSSRYSKINLREMGQGRVVCGECSAWRKERRREEMSEEELVELTRALRRRGEGIRTGFVEG